MTTKRNRLLEGTDKQLQAMHVKFIRDALKNFGINPKSKARCRFTVVADKNAPKVYYIGEQFTIKKEYQGCGYSKWVLFQVHIVPGDCETPDHASEDIGRGFRSFYQCVKEMIMRVIDNDFDNFADNFQAD